MKNYLSLTLAASLLAALNSTAAETNTPPASTGTHILTPAEQAAAFKDALRSEKARTACIEGRRYIAGRVMEITPEGLVVDSGYSVLLNPPFNQSWVVPGNASVTRDANPIEERSPGAVCIGLVNLVNLPRRPAVKVYDYVVIQAYPAGQMEYKPVPHVEKMLRRYSASLENAVKLALARGE